MDKHADELEVILLADFAKLAKKGNLLSFEVPSRVVLSKVTFTPENNMLTPSFKIKRASVEKHFDKEIQHVMDHPMQMENMDEKLRQVVNEVLGKNTTVQLDGSFALQGGDSLSAVRIVSKIKEKFGKEVPLSYVLNNPSLEDLAKMVSEETLRSEAPTLPSLAKDDLKVDVKTFVGAAKGQCVNLADAKEVLLTGATGFLGAFLLRDLLTKFPQMKVVCLVRGNAERLGKALLEKRISVDMSRVEILVGNLEDGLLGCQDVKSFNALSRRIDAVFHSAAHVNWMLSYEKLRQSNVNCCSDLIRFCSTNKPKHLYHVSTVSCCPMRYQEGKSVYETYEGIADENYAALLGPYAQSKWVAEQQLLKCVPDLNLSIFRPANICPDSVSGSSNFTDYIHRYVHTAVSLGFAMDEAAVINFTPVDFCTEAILSVATGQKQTAEGTIFNISNNESPSYFMIGQALVALGFNLKLGPYSEFRKAFVSCKTKEKLLLYGLLPMFTEKAWIYNATHDSDATNTKKFFLKSECPKVDLSYLEKWLTFLVETGFLPKPETKTETENADK